MHAFKFHRIILEGHRVLLLKHGPEIVLDFLVNLASHVRGRQDFDGQIRAANRPEGGAELTVELPRYLPQTVRAEAQMHA